MFLKFYQIFKAKQIQNKAKRKAFRSCTRILVEMLKGNLHTTRMILTSKRFIQLNPVLEDKVAVVLPVPEPGLPVELSHTSL